MEVFWTDFAKNELFKIYSFYKQKASITTSKKLVESIVNTTINLQNQPFSGPIEELLIDLKEEFRYLIFSNYKIIYWINTEKNRIEIVDIFDTRQNPIKMKRAKN
jgi:plasmid stabilization system protein ParE